MIPDLPSPTAWAEIEVWGSIPHLGSIHRIHYGHVQASQLLGRPMVRVDVPVRGPGHPLTTLFYDAVANFRVREIAEADALRRAEMARPAAWHCAARAA